MRTLDRLMSVRLVSDTNMSVTREASSEWCASRVEVLFTARG